MDSVNFDRAAGYYDQTRALPAESMDGLTTVLAAELAARQPCLEIGVGTGRIALPLHDRGVKIVGMDIAAAMLGQMAANAGGRSPVPLLRADATRLPVAAGTFGAVLAFHVLHLIPGWRVAVDESLRVLRPGGALIARFPTVGRSARTSRESPAGVPWSAVLREALLRHGIIRIALGARDPDAIAGYLAGRATPRQLEPVPVLRTRTLGQVLSNIERQIFSWSWPYPQEQVRAASSDIRAWAGRENLPLDAEFPVRTEIRWWAFDVPR